MSADFLLAERRIGFDFQFHLRQSVEIASPQRDFDGFAALATEREDAVEARQFTCNHPILVVFAALIAKIAQLQKIFAVFGNSEINQRIQAIDVFAADQFLARRVQQSQRRIQR